MREANASPDDRVPRSARRPDEGAGDDAGRSHDAALRALTAACSTTIAFVAVAGEPGDWIVSSVGLGDRAPAGIGELGVLVADRDTWVAAPDARTDERCRGHALVTAEPHARSLAVAAITSSTGDLLGVVVVIDTEVREWTAAQIDVLQAVARQVATQIEQQRHIEEQRASLAALAGVAERQRLLDEAAGEGTWDFDLSLRSLHLSPRVFGMLGLSGTPGSVPMAAIWPILHPDDRRGVMRALVHQLRRGNTFDYEFRCRHASGGWRWYRARAAVAAAAGERASRRLVGSLVDTHETHQSREHLHRVSRLLAESQALARVGGWELDLATEEVFWTAETYRIHETSPRDFAPTVASAIEFYAPEGQPRLRAALEDAMARGRAFSLDLELITARKRRIWVRVTGGAVFAKSKAVRLLGAFQDITAQRRLDEELVRAKEAAVAASEAKSAFLAAMSHEIRTPMHTVLGYVDMLRDSPLNDEQQECADIIANSGSSLLRLIDDILDFSKAEAGKMVLEQKAFDMRQVADEVALMLQPQARPKDLAVEVCCDDDDADLSVLADQQRARQVLVNLTGNAVKFTPRGSVSIRLTGRDGMVRCEVQDTGIGIPSDQLTGLFDDFVQVDTSTHRSFGGTGLGLAISKHLVEGMGGAIGVESELGAGSTFWFELPAAESAAPHNGADQPLPATDELALLRGAKILVVEDNRLNLRLAVRALESFGVEVATACDGSDAVDIVAQHEFDLVLMDCLMPGMDGFEATRTIRQREQDGARRLPIVALTANALPEDREACMQAGMDGFVTKPFKRAALMAVIARQLAASQAAATSRPTRS